METQCGDHRVAGGVRKGLAILHSGILVPTSLRKTWSATLGGIPLVAERGCSGPGERCDLFHSGNASVGVTRREFHRVTCQNLPCSIGRSVTGSSLAKSDVSGDGAEDAAWCDVARQSKTLTYVNICGAGTVDSPPLPDPPHHRLPTDPRPPTGPTPTDSARSACSCGTAGTGRLAT